MGLRHGLKTQLAIENIAIYTEEMTRLFRHADPTMNEVKKLSFLIKGVKQELFAGFLRNPPKTIAEFASEASTFEKPLEIPTWQYNRSLLMPNYTEAQALGSDDLREVIRAVVRK